MTKRLAQLKRRNLLTAPRDHFTCALGFFVHKYLINLTLRKRRPNHTRLWQNARDPIISRALYFRRIVSWRHLITL